MLYYVYGIPKLHSLHVQFQINMNNGMANGTVPIEFEHQRRRKVAIKCLELEGMLESQG